MANDTPATKADLQAMKGEILKALGDMNEVMHRQFHKELADANEVMHQQFQKELSDANDITARQFHKEMADMSEVMQRQFHFVAEELAKISDRLDRIESRLDAFGKNLLTDVSSYVAEDHGKLRDHARRIDRLERKVGIAT